MSLEFDKYAAKGNEVVNLLAEDLNVPRNKAARILRASLHALRNRLSMEESFQLLAQLPMALKSVYVDNWKPNLTFTRIHHLSEFLKEIREADGELAGYDFGNDQQCEKYMEGVFRVLNFFVSDGEMHDVMGVMPEALKQLFKKSIGENRMTL